MATEFISLKTAGLTLEAKFTQISDGYVWSAGAWADPAGLTNAETEVAIVALSAVTTSEAGHIGYTLAIPAGVVTPCIIEVFVGGAIIGVSPKYAGNYLASTILTSTGADLILKTSTFALAMADAVWDELLTGALHNTATSAGRRLREANLGQAIADEGTAQGGGASTITLALTAEGSVDDLYHEALVFIAAGTGAGQVRFILSYDAASRVATVHAPWEVNPIAGSEYIVYGNAASNLHAIQDDKQSATDLKDFVDAGYNPATNAVTAVSSLTTEAITDVWSTDALTEAYAIHGSTATPAQLLYMLWSALSQFSITTDTITTYELDGTTPEMTFTLDDATTPTSRVRAT